MRNFFNDSNINHLSILYRLFENLFLGMLKIFFKLNFFLPRFSILYIEIIKFGPFSPPKPGDKFPVGIYYFELRCFLLHLSSAK